MIVGVLSVGDHHEDGMEFEQDEPAPEAEAGADQIEDREELLAEKQLKPQVSLSELLHPVTGDPAQS